MTTTATIATSSLVHHHDYYHNDNENIHYHHSHPASFQSCIPPVMYLYPSSGLLSCIIPVLHSSCHVSLFLLSCITPVSCPFCNESLLSFILPIFHPFCLSFPLSCIPPVLWFWLYPILLPLSFPTSLLSCLIPFRSPSCPPSLLFLIILPHVMDTSCPEYIHPVQMRMNNRNV